MVIARLATWRPQAIAIEAGVGRAVRSPPPLYRSLQGYDRKLSVRPGLRALVIVRASHKAYLEAYLNQMHDVRIEDVEAVLR